MDAVPYSKVTITVEPLDGSQAAQYVIPKAAGIKVTTEEVEEHENFWRGDDSVIRRGVSHVLFSMECKGLMDDEQKFLVFGLTDVS